MKNLTVNVADYALWTALVTPFDEQGKVDYPSLAQLAHQQAAAGNGILLLGSTGEGLALSEGEQQEIVSFVCQLQLNAPLMVAVGGYSLDTQLRWIEFCNALAIDAYLLAAPLYAKPGPQGQELWFRALLQASDYPCMLYNVPSRSGVELDPSALAKLTNEPTFWSLKEASGSEIKFSEFKQQLPTIDIYSGDDALLPEFARLGAQGLVSVCSNVWPQATHLYVKQCLSTGQDAALPIWKSAINSLFSVANPIPVKVLMHQQYQLSTPQLRLPLTHVELTCSDLLQASHRAITQWYNQHHAMSS